SNREIFMASTDNWYKEFLAWFHAEKEFLAEQLNLMEPMGNDLRKPVAHRVFSAGWLLFLELVCYLAGIAFIALIFFMSKIFPFYLLSEMQSKYEVSSVMGSKNIEVLTWYVRGFLILIGVLFFICAKNFGRIRAKNRILNRAGRNLQLLAGQVLARKASMDTLENRYFDGLASIEKLDADGQIKGDVN